MLAVPKSAGLFQILLALWVPFTQTRKQVGVILEMYTSLKCILLPQRTLMTWNLQFLKLAFGLSSFCPEISPCDCEVNNTSEIEVAQNCYPGKITSLGSFKRERWLCSIREKTQE